MPLSCHLSHRSLFLPPPVLLPQLLWFLLISSWPGTPCSLASSPATLSSAPSTPRGLLLAVPPSRAPGTSPLPSHWLPPSGAPAPTGLQPTRTCRPAPSPRQTLVHPLVLAPSLACFALSSLGPVTAALVKPCLRLPQPWLERAHGGLTLIPTLDLQGPSAPAHLLAHSQLLSQNVSRQGSHPSARGWHLARGPLPAPTCLASPRHLVLRVPSRPALCCPGCPRARPRGPGLARSSPVTPGPQPVSSTGC